MKNLLWIGDAACPSGFARATHEILDVLRYSYNVTVLGMNYFGDPARPGNEFSKYYVDGHWPYPIYSCAPGGDAYGIGRLIWACDLVKPDAIILQNDPWNIGPYLQQLKRFPEYEHVPVVAVMPVDGKNFSGRELNPCRGHNGLAAAIFWTQFGLNEAQRGGLTCPAFVIPLGVDLETYHPEDRIEARHRRHIPAQLDDAFIVGNVNRNQPRKRWDLTIKFFADWIYSGVSEDARHPEMMVVKDAFLYLHVAPTGDTGIKIKQLAAYYGVLQRLLLVEPQTFYGLTEAEMRDTYNCFDVAVSTTQGEGHGLTAFEAAACGKPLILPDWAALGEFFKGHAWMVPCTSTAIGPPYVNVIGGVPDQKQFTSALWTMYRNSKARETNAQAALELAQEDRFRWPNIGDAWNSVLNQVLDHAERELAG